jgi:transposase
MNIFEFERIARSEREARRYLLGRCREAAQPRCPACSRDRLYKVESGRRRRCAQCGHTFNPFAGRWLDELRVSTRQWLWIIKLFELEKPATIVADELGISYPTSFKGIDVIRRAIASLAGSPADREVGPDEDHPPIVLGTSAHLAADGPIVDLPHGSVLLPIGMSGGCLILTDRGLDLGSLRCRDRIVPLVDLGKSYPPYRVYCSENGFWPYAKERLGRYHGVSRAKLPLYLREMEFRWIHRNGDLFESIVMRLCAFMPVSVTGIPKARRESTLAPRTVGTR